MRGTEGRIAVLGSHTIMPPELRSSGVAAALVLSASGNVVAINDHLLKLLGWSAADLVGRNARKVLLAGAADWGPWEAVARGAEHSAATLNLKTRDGRTLVLSGDVTATGLDSRTRVLRGLFVDATAQQHLENALTHASRMEAVASLTSGIAHDFSNLLTVLVGNLYLISEGVRDHPALHEKTKLTRDAAKRGTGLIKQLLAFARNEWARTPTVDPRKVVANLDSLLRRALGSRVTLETHVAEDIVRFRGDTAQYESAIVNLVMNARDALGDNGRIELRVTNATLRAPEAAAHGVAPGDYVRTTVADNGGGIPPELLDRVFEPYFSTKPAGVGTGLGLAMVRLFAVRNGGTVLLQSEVHRGTTVSMLLPRGSEEENATSVNTAPLSTLPVGSESVLVFAEEPELRETIQQTLGVLGYKVRLTSDSNEALLAARSARLDLAVVDVQPGPRATGLRLVETLATHAPRLRIIALRDSATVHYSHFATLQKPFDLPTLATTVRKVLDGAPR